MAKRRTILVVEDDEGIRQGICDALEFEGHASVAAETGEVAMAKLERIEPDLVLLDLVLPGVGGLDVLRAIRRRLAPPPVIILTARGDEPDRVRGLRAGADDYVVKPFSVRELLARVDAVLRRSAERPRARAQLRVPGLDIDGECRTVTFPGGEMIELSEREFELLAFLASNAGRAVSREEILSCVWRLDPAGVETRTVDMHVARLREKLRVSASGEALLVTVRGRGYMLRSENGGGT